jgi:uncharacterized protein involved in exopolysaccharide biosynthesis
MTDPAVPTTETEVYEGLLGYLPSILIQRRWFVLVPEILCTAAGFGLAFVLPTQYESAATVVVVSKDLPDDIAASPLNDVIDQRIAKIKQQVLSRPDLIEIIQNNNLYDRQRRSQPLSAIIDMMRDATSISPVTADVDRSVRQRTTSNTIAFQISFRYSDAAKAQAVTQQFTEKLLRLDSTQLAAQADATVGFLRDQQTGIQNQINEIEGKIEDIKSHNGLALSRIGGFMPSVSGYDVQIAALQRDNTELSARMTNAVQVGDDRVAAAEAALAAAKAVYSDNHPDVIAAQQKLTEARAQAKSTGAKPMSNPAIAAQIAANNRSIASLNAARSGEAARASAAMSAQSGAPLIEEEIRQLQSKSDGLRRNLDHVAGSLLAAEAAQKMENQQRGERLVLVDPPTAPDKPISPNRPLLMIGGIAIGTMLGIGLALLMEFLTRPIRGAAAIQNLLGVGPLVVIPTIKRGSANAKKRAPWWRRIFRRTARA